MARPKSAEVGHNIDLSVGDLVRSLIVSHFRQTDKLKATDSGVYDNMRCNVLVRALKRSICLVA